MTLVASGPTSGVWSAVPVWNFIPVTPTYSPGGGNRATLQLSQIIFLSLSVFREITTFVKC